MSQEQEQAKWSPNAKLGDIAFTPAPDKDPEKVEMLGKETSLIDVNEGEIFVSHVLVRYDAISSDTRGLHTQIKCNPINRPYGMVFDAMLQGDTELVDTWWASYDSLWPSLATANPTYRYGALVISEGFLFYRFLGDPANAAEGLQIQIADLSEGLEEALVTLKGQNTLPPHVSTVKEDSFLDKWNLKDGTNPGSDGEGNSGDGDTADA